LLLCTVGEERESGLEEKKQSADKGNMAAQGSFPGFGKVMPKVMDPVRGETS
jgi:hypothetical protein